MSATPNSGDGPRLSAWVAVLLALLGLGWGSLGAQESFPNSVPGAAARAKGIYMAERVRWEAQPTNAAIAWALGRACFDWAEFATNDTQRATIAAEGIAVCRVVARDHPGLAAGRYYLGLNLGQSARTKYLGALKLIPEIEAEFKAARELDARLDFAGPDRSLGLLYLDAPGWPVSLGDQAKARHHLLKAVELAPEHPENRLCLLEAALRWRDRRLIDRERKALAELLPRARERLQGAGWVVSWVDWERRWKVAKGP